MEFFELTPMAEKLLSEIIKHSNNTTEYWRERFEGLTKQEDQELRATFKELQAKKYINVSWADNHPWTIKISSEGSQYATLKENKRKEEKKLSWHDWMIGIVGALIGLIPFLVSLFNQP